MDVKNLALPDTWRIMKIGEVYKFTKKPRGLVLKDYESIPFYPMDSIQIGRKKPCNPIMKSPESLGSGTYFENGNLLLAKITPSFENGKQAIIRDSFEFGYATTEVIPLKEIDGVSDINYLFYLLLHPTFRNELAGQMEGTTGRQRLSKDILGRRPIPLPPVAEQRRIAAILSTVQRSIEQQERQIALTTELKKALMHKLFTEGTRGEPQKETEIGLMPESWEVAELGSAVDLVGGYAFKSKEAVAHSNTQLIRMGNLYQNKLDLSRKPMFYPDFYAKKYDRFVLKSGDLIMSLTGTSGKEDYGFTVEIGNIPKKLLLNQRVARIDLKTDKIDNEFLLYFLLSRKFLDFLYPTAKGMKQANLSTYAMKKLKIVIPDINEQKDIAMTFRFIDKKNLIHESSADKLKDLFRTLLNQLMTAQIRVNDIDPTDLDIDQCVLN